MYPYEAETTDQLIWREFVESGFTTDSQDPMNFPLDHPANRGISEFEKDLRVLYMVD